MNFLSPILQITSFAGLLLLLNGCGSRHTGNTTSSVNSSAQAALVQTAAGPVAGYLDGPVATYKGIPYARCERFMPPTELAVWKPRSSRAYGPVAPQEKRTGWWFDQMGFWFDWNDGFESENCLNLNIWTSAHKTDTPRPVMVWLHGGGFSTGSSHELPAYDGRSLAATDEVVVVSVNHRLNVLGFLDLSACGEKYAQSGNVGMLDIVAALKWVQTNIAAFGGDPANVTVFGQSGGGGKVSTLMAMPAAKGLFHKAIVQSGSMNRVMETAWSQRIGLATLRELGLSASQAELLAEIPYSKLLAAGNKAIADVRAEAEREGVPGSFLFGWAPTVDGDILPAQPFAPEAPSQSSDIPMLIGTTIHEFLGESLLNSELQQITLSQARERLMSRYGEDTDAYIEAFGRAYPGFRPRDLFDIDLRFRPTAVEQATRKAEQQAAPVYMYLFTWESPALDTMFRSFHCIDLPFVFDNIDRCRPMTGGGKDAYALARKMSSAWIAFARNGNPTTKLLPEWPAYTPEEGATMRLDNDCGLLYRHDAELLQIVARH